MLPPSGCYPITPTLKAVLWALKIHKACGAVSKKTPALKKCPGVGHRKRIKKKNKNSKQGRCSRSQLQEVTFTHTV